MAIPVFGLQAIKDKATRDAIFNLAQRAGIGGGEGGATVEVQEADPVNEPGTEGDIIYATGSESIWVFVNTSWERASSAASGITVLVEAYRDDPDSNQAVNWATPFLGVTLASPNFKNDSAQVLGLAPRIYEGGEEVSNDIYNAASTSYSWLKNGQTFTPAQTQTSNTGIDRRVLLINQDDVADGNINEVFTCVIDY